MVLLLITKCRYGLAQLHLVANRLHQRRIILLHNADNLVAAHCLNILAFNWLTEASFEHLRKVLLLHKLLVQLLDTCHLVVAEPIGCFLLLQLVNHLSIQLTIVNLALIINKVSFWNLDTDVSTASCWVCQTLLTDSVCLSLACCLELMASSSSRFTRRLFVRAISLSNLFERLR